MRGESAANHVAKEAVSAALQTKTRQRSEGICKPNDARSTKPRPSVKTMLDDYGPLPIMVAIFVFMLLIVRDTRGASSESW